MSPNKMCSSQSDTSAEQSTWKLRSLLETSEGKGHLTLHKQAPQTLRSVILELRRVQRVTYVDKVSIDVVASASFELHSSLVVWTQY